MLLIYKKELVREIDHKKTGAAHANLRKQAGVSQVDMAKAMKISPSGLCQLERALADRKWTAHLATRYESVLARLAK